MKEHGRQKIAIIHLSEISFTELVLSIGAISSAGKITFGIVKSCKTKEYVDGNVTLAQEKWNKSMIQSQHVC
jgi:hypothetical protein